MAAKNLVFEVADKPEKKHYKPSSLNPKYRLSMTWALVLGGPGCG